MKRILAVTVLSFFSLNVFSQNEDPVSWNFASRKKAAGTYELVLTASIEHPWHIYSQYTPEGGPLPTKVEFQSNPLLKLQGKTIEEGHLESQHDKTFDLEVKYFSDQVAFVQTLTRKGTVKTGARGSVEYMVCNDGKCLPPVKKTFDIKLD